MNYYSPIWGFIDDSNKEYIMLELHELLERLQDSR